MILSVVRTGVEHIGLNLNPFFFCMIGFSLPITHVFLPNALLQKAMFDIAGKVNLNLNV